MNFISTNEGISRMVTPLLFVGPPRWGDGLASQTTLFVVQTRGKRHADCPVISLCKLVIPKSDSSFDI